MRASRLPAPSHRFLALGVLGLAAVLATPSPVAACANAMLGAEAGERHELANVAVLIVAGVLGTRLRTLHAGSGWRTDSLRIVAAVVLAAATGVPLLAGFVGQAFMALFLLGFTAGATLVRIGGATRQRRRFIGILAVPWVITTLLTLVTDVRLEGAVDVGGRVAAALALTPSVLLALTSWIAIEPRRAIVAAARQRRIAGARTAESPARSLARAA